MAKDNAEAVNRSLEDLKTQLLTGSPAQFKGSVGRDGIDGIGRS